MGDSMSVRLKALVDRVSVAAFVVAWAILFVRLAPVIASGISSQTTAAETWLALIMGLIAGYLLADLLAGVVHWVADRFFDPRTPLLGPMLIAPFREHHEDALGITRHDFFEVSGNNALVTFPLVVALAMQPAPAGFLAHFLAFIGASATLGLFFTNQIHSWAHAPAPPPLVRRLQTLGLILRPAAHARHHRHEHDRAYCVTSGWLNPLLDRIGLFAGLESIGSKRRSRKRRAT